MGWSDGLEPTCTRFTGGALDHFGIDQQKTWCHGLELNRSAVPRPLRGRELDVRPHLLGFNQALYRLSYRDRLFSSSASTFPSECKSLDARSVVTVGATYGNRTRLDRSTTGSHPRCATWQLGTPWRSRTPRGRIWSPTCAQRPTYRRRGDGSMSEDRRVRA